MQQMIFVHFFIWVYTGRFSRARLPGILENTVARGIALYRGFGEVPNVGSRKCKKPKIFMAFEGLRHHLNVL
jgi:hypothetical protein